MNPCVTRQQASFLTGEPPRRPENGALSRNRSIPNRARRLMRKDELFAFSEMDCRDVYGLPGFKWFAINIIIIGQY